jgi:hypothetical protein
MKVPAAALLLLTAACTSTLESERPLFESGAGQPRPGLWALLEPGCAEPKTAVVQAWPDCAAPLWLTENRVTAIIMTAAHWNYVLAPGDPAVLQLETVARADAANQGPAYSYLAVAPEGAAPYARARVWEAECGAGETGCTASNAQAVRARLAGAVAKTPGRLAVWVAP